MEWNDLDTLASYQGLKASCRQVDLTKVMSGDEGTNRVHKYQVAMGGGMKYYFAAKQVDDEILMGFAALPGKPAWLRNMLRSITEK